MRKFLRSFMKPFVLAGFLCFGIIYAQAAWNEPSQNPPSGNVDAPVSVGSVDQIKSGGLGVGSLSVFGNQYTQGNLGVGVVSPTQKLDVDGYVRGGNGLCIGDDCRDAWPGGGWPSGSYCIFRNGGSCPSGFYNELITIVVGAHGHDMCPGDEVAGDSTFQGSGICNINIRMCCK